MRPVEGQQGSFFEAFSVMPAYDLETLRHEAHEMKSSKNGFHVSGQKGNTLSAVNHEATNHQSSTSRIRRDKRNFLMDWDPESNPPSQNPNASSANARRSSVSTAWHPNRNKASVSHCFNINYGVWHGGSDQNVVIVQRLSFDWIIPLNEIFDVERRFVMVASRYECSNALHKRVLMESFLDNRGLPQRFQIASCM